METFELNLFVEVCCDECGNIVHNHIDCPVCKDGYASTENYGELEDSDVVVCECGAEFKLIKNSWYGNPIVEIIKRS